jgi:energy-converting hydrogenase A subunit R
VRLTREQLGKVKEMEEMILRDLYAEDLSTGTKDELIQKRLDAFFWGGGLWDALAVPDEGVTVVGGRRKAWVMEAVARDRDISLRNAVFVGDSITDVQGARMVESLGGLAVAFNGNAFILPHVTVAVAANRLDSVYPILEAWGSGGRAQVRRLIDQATAGAEADGPHLHWMVGCEGKRLDEIIAVHKVFRRRMREAAAKLG